MKVIKLTPVLVIILFSLFAFNWIKNYGYRKGLERANYIVDKYVSTIENAKREAKEKKGFLDSFFYKDENPYDYTLRILRYLQRDVQIQKGD